MKTATMMMLILASLGLFATTGCSDLKCDLQYEACLADCKGDGCKLECKLERKWCKF